MYLSEQQFGSNPNVAPVAPKPLNKGVRKMYKQLTEQLTIELKQAKLAREICYPWQLGCNADPTKRNGRNKYKLN